MERRKFYWVILFFSVAFLAHLVVRNYFAGSMIGAYGKDFDAFKPGQYAYEYLKFWFRIVMVPVSNVYLFLSGAFVLLGALIYAGFKISNRDQQSKNLIKG
ncbi:MAG: hypothetical protein ACXWV5_03930, partial [Flavitalea sp.]